MKATAKTAKIIERGRGPEIYGTRITVYTIYEYDAEGATVEEMMEYFQLTREQVQTALDYIAAHRKEVKAGYKRIMERVRKGNPRWVDTGRARTPEELKRRIAARMAKEKLHARNGR